MPAWVTHLVTGNKISDRLNITDKNSFLFGNVVPDILNGYIVKEISIHEKYEMTHFTESDVINGVKCKMPNPDKFLSLYKDRMDNMVILGAYVHLLTDYYWNKISYEKFFRQEGELVKLKFNDGTTNKYEYNDAIKVKQEDFKIFTYYLKKNYKLERVFYTDKFLDINSKISEIPLTRQDIVNAISAIDNYIDIKEQIDNNYRLFKENEIKEEFEKSLEFIEEKLRKM